MPASGCAQLARAVKELTKLPLEQQGEALKSMSSAFNCVECSQSANFENITAGGSVSIGDVNQIMSCGIGNSGGTQMVDQLKKFIDEKESKINTNVNKKIDLFSKNVDDRILKNQIELRKEIQKISTIGGSITCILFTLIIILVIMKILGI